MHRFILLLGLVVAGFAAPGELAAQYTTYRVRIYNETGVEIRVKIIGFEMEAFAIRELDIDAKALIPRMLHGDRVFVAWDDVTQEVVSSGVIRVDSNMRVRFRPMEPQAGYSSTNLNMQVERVQGEP